jgi:uncharacterized protein
MRAITNKGINLGNTISVASSLTARIKGLLGKHSLPAGEGLLIKPCKGIHTYFMKFSIDAAFLDKDNQIVSLVRDLPPNRMTPIYFKANAVLELPAGVLTDDVAVGDSIDFT